MRTLTGQIAIALTALANAAQTTRWTTPIGTQRHLAQLRDLIALPRCEPYPERFTFPPTAEHDVAVASQEVLLLAERLDDPRVKDLVDGEVERTSSHVAAIASRNAHRISVWSHTHVGLPSEATQQKARELLKVHTSPKAPCKTSNSSTLALTMQQALDDHRLSEWRIEESADMAARASVAGYRKVIRIRSGLSFGPEEVDRLVVHEIEGHVLRWENARRQPEPLLAIPFGNSTATEEGLAVQLEEELGNVDVWQMKIYAARALGVVLASEFGIVEVARCLADHVGVEAAAAIALRAKRGLEDPNEEGGPTKDHSYLTGYLAVTALDKETRTLLRGVKWPLELVADLKRMMGLGLVRPPQLTPNAPNTHIKPDLPLASPHGNRMP